MQDPTEELAAQSDIAATLDQLPQQTLARVDTQTVRADRLAAATDREQQRITGRDLANRGIAHYTTPAGRVAEITDPMDVPMTGYDKRNSVAWDSSGEPRRISFDPMTGNPITAPAYDNAPTTTDKAGNIYKAPAGLPWQQVGVDPQIAAQTQQKTKATLDNEADAALAAPQAHQSARYRDAFKAVRQSARDTQAQFSALGLPATDPTGRPAYDLNQPDPETLRGHIEESFNREYAAPAANAKPFLGGGQFSDAATKLREDIGNRKAQTMDLANRHIGLSDQMQQERSALDDIVSQRQTLKANRLADVNAKRVAAGLEPARVPQIPGTEPLSAGASPVGEQVGSNAPDLTAPAEPSSTAAEPAAATLATSQQPAAVDIHPAATLYERAKNFVGSLVGGAASAVGEIARSPVGKASAIVSGWQPVLEIATGHKPGAISEATGEALGKLPGVITDPAFADNGEAKAGRFIGGVIPYIAAGAVAPEVMIPALFGAGYQGQYEAAKAHQADDDTAMKAGVLGGAINSVLGLPLGSAGEVVAGLFGKATTASVAKAMSAAYEAGGAPAVAAELEALKATIARVGVAGDVPAAFKEAITGGLDGVIKEITASAAQRAAQVAKRAAIGAVSFGGVQAGQNVVEQQTYNPEKPITEGVGEAALGGAVLSGLFGGIEQVGKARGAKQAREEIASALANQARLVEPTKGLGGEPPAPPVPVTPPIPGAPSAGPAAAPGGEAPALPEGEITAKTHAEAVSKADGAVQLARHQLSIANGMGNAELIAEKQQAVDDAEKRAEERTGESLQDARAKVAAGTHEWIPDQGLRKIGEGTVVEPSSKPSAQPVQEPGPPHGSAEPSAVPATTNEPTEQKQKGATPQQSPPAAAPVGQPAKKDEAAGAKVEGEVQPEIELAAREKELDAMDKRDPMRALIAGRIKELRTAIEQAQPPESAPAIPNLTPQPHATTETTPAKPAQTSEKPRTPTEGHAAQPEPVPETAGDRVAPEVSKAITESGAKLDAVTQLKGKPHLQVTLKDEGREATLHIDAGKSPDEIKAAIEAKRAEMKGAIKPGEATPEDIQRAIEAAKKPPVRGAVEPSGEAVPGAASKPVAKPVTHAFHEDAAVKIAPMKDAQGRPATHVIAIDAKGRGKDQPESIRDLAKSNVFKDAGPFTKVIAGRMEKGKFIPIPGKVTLAEAPKSAPPIPGVEHNVPHGTSVEQVAPATKPPEKKPSASATTTPEPKPSAPATSGGAEAQKLDEQPTRSEAEQFPLLQVPRMPKSKEVARNQLRRMVERQARVEGFSEEEIQNTLKNFSYFKAGGDRLQSLDKRLRALEAEMMPKVEMAQAAADRKQLRDITRTIGTPSIESGKRRAANAQATASGETEAKFLTVEVPDAEEARKKVAAFNETAGAIQKEAMELEDAIKKLAPEVVKSTGSKWERGQIKKSAPKAKVKQYLDWKAQLEKKNDAIRELRNSAAPSTKIERQAMLAKRVNDEKLPSLGRLAARREMMFDDWEANGKAVPKSLEDAINREAGRVVREKYPDATDAEVAKATPKLAALAGNGHDYDRAFELDSELNIGDRRAQELADFINPNRQQYSVSIDDFSQSLRDRINAAIPNYRPHDKRNEPSKPMSRAEIDSIKADIDAEKADQKTRADAQAKIDAEEAAIKAEAAKKVETIEASDAKTKAVTDAYQDALEAIRAKNRKAAAGVIGQKISDPSTAPKVLKAQREYLADAIKNAIEQSDDSGRVRFDVPHDGTFIIGDTKEQLRDFEKRVRNAFTVPGSTLTPQMQKPSGEARRAPAKVEDAKLVTLLNDFVSDDERRFELASAMGDGKQVIATNGRVVVAVTVPNPGKPEALARINTANGKQITDEDEMPSQEASAKTYKQISDYLEGEPTGAVLHMPVEELFRMASAAEALNNEDKPVRLWRNKDGTVGVTLFNGADTDPGGNNGYYEANKDADAIAITTIPARRFRDVLAFMAKAGEETVKISTTSASKPEAIKLEGVRVRALITGAASEPHSEQMEMLANAGVPSTPLEAQIEREESALEIMREIVKTDQSAKPPHQRTTEEDVAQSEKRLANLKEKQSKKTDKGMLSAGTPQSAPFYSQLTRTLEALPQETMTVTQAKAAILKGAKADEIKLSGILDDPLSPLAGKAPGDKVSKSDLTGYALERQAKVLDVVLGGEAIKWHAEKDGNGDEYFAAYREAGERPFLRIEKVRDGYGLFDAVSNHRIALRESLESAKEAAEKQEPSTAHFSQYQLPGADEGSYREMFVTWPRDPAETLDLTRERDAAWQALKEMDDLGFETTADANRAILSHPDFAKRWEIDADKLPILNAYREAAERKIASQGWRDGHSQFSEIANPIVRIRRNIRTDTDGKKTYFIEEIQGPGKAEQEKMPPEIRKRIYEIGMKRALRDAADEGADRLAWTTGEQQAERYSLEKHIDSIAWHTHNGEKFWTAYKNDAAILSGKMSEAEESIGKEVAQKIADGPDVGELAGVDLKVGGEGLMRLYDSTLPRIANELAKKFGVKVGKSEIATPDESKQPYRLMWEETPGNWREAFYGTRAEMEAKAREDGPRYRAEPNVDKTTTIHSLEILGTIREQQRGGNPLFAGKPSRTALSSPQPHETEKNHPSDSRALGAGQEGQAQSGGGGLAQKLLDRHPVSAADVTALPQPEIGHLAAAGVTMREGPDGPAGMNIDTATLTIERNAETIVTHAGAIGKAGGDGQQWVESIHFEEAHHTANLVLTGNAFASVNATAFRKATPEAQKAMREAYPFTTDEAALGAEYLARLSMRRAGVMLPERASRSYLAAVARLERELDKPQDPFIESLWENIETVTAGDDTFQKGRIYESDTTKTNTADDRRNPRANSQTLGAPAPGDESARPGESGARGVYLGQSPHWRGQDVSGVIRRAAKAEKLMVRSGYRLVERATTALSGIETKIWESEVHFSPQKLDRAARVIGGRGRDVDEWIRSLIQHEAIHAADIARIGPAPLLEKYLSLTKAMPPEMMEAYSDYGGATSGQLISAEHIARLTQCRLTGGFTEETIGYYTPEQLAKMRRVLDMDQPDAIEAHVRELLRFLMEDQTLSAGLPQPVTQAAKDAHSYIQEMLDDAASVVLPGNLAARNDLRRPLGAMHHLNEKYLHALARFRNEFNKEGPNKTSVKIEDNPFIKLMSDISMGRPVDPRFEPFVKLKEKMEAELKAAYAAAGGKTLQWREDYMKGAWTAKSRKAFGAAIETAIEQGLIPKDYDVNAGTEDQMAIVKTFADQYLADDKESEEAALAYLAKRPLMGRESFRKAKTFTEDIARAWKHGLQAVSNNPAEIESLVLAEMTRSIMGNQVLRVAEARGDVTKEAGLFKPPSPEYEKIQGPLGEMWGNPDIRISEAFDKRQMDALNRVADALGIPQERRVKIGGTRWGYQQTAGDPEVVTKFAGPESVLAHEIGHAIDDRYNVHKSLLAHPDDDLRRKYKKELRDLADMRFEGDEASDYFKKYVRRGVEKAAVMVEAYIHAPDVFKNTAPNVYEWFSNLVKNDPKLAGLDEAKPSLVLGSAGNTVYAGGMVIKGYRWAKKPFADVLNNFLSKTLYQQRALGKPFSLWMGAASALNQMQLGAGLSAFHAAFTTAEVQITANANVLRDLFGVLRGSRTLAQLRATMATAATAMVKTPMIGDEVLSAWRDTDGNLDPRMQSVVDALEIVGAGFTMERGMMTDQRFKAMSDWKNEHELRAALRSPVAAMEWMSSWIMEGMVPRQKAGVFAREVWRIQEQHPGVPLKELSAELNKAWNAVDAKLGQVRWDRMFMNGVVKNCIQGLVRAPGWSGGTLNQLLGAFKDVYDFLNQWRRGSGGGAGGPPGTGGSTFGENAPGEMPRELPPRVAYMLMLLLTVGAAGALLTYLFTGKKPEGLDYWAFRTGGVDEHGRPERFVLPTYMKDLLSYVKDPGKTLIAKAHPLLSIIGDLIRNKDYYGVEISHADDNAFRRLADKGKYVAKAFEPFWMRGVRRETERHAGPLRTALPLIGIMPAPKAMTQTPAERLADQYAKETVPIGARTQAQADASKARYQLVEAIRANRAPDFQAEIAAGHIKPGDIPQLMARAQLSPLQYQVKKLALDRAEHVYARATPQERRQLDPILAAKRARAVPAMSGRLPAFEMK